MYLLLSCKFALSDALHKPWTKCFMPVAYIQCSSRYSGGGTDAEKYNTVGPVLI